MNKTHILIRLLWMYIPRNWEFRSALAKLRNLGGGGGVTPPHFVTPLSQFQFCLFVSSFLPAIFLSLLIFFPFSLFVLSLHKKGRLKLKRSQGEGEVFP
jgi:hypothetical protein